MAHAPGIDRRRVDELTERELARFVAERVRLGTQFLMPTEDAVLVAEELARRWGMPRCSSRSRAGGRSPRARAERGDVARVLTEPALTNAGVVQPDQGFHAGVRRLTRETGTVLIVDETHTLICGPGGLVRRWGLEPDIVTLGKSIGGGVPTGAYGMRADADGRRARRPARRAHRGGVRADRGVWEAMEWAGPAVSVPATADDVERYVATVGELLESLVA